jgi:tetratricopeptide (TPR) repeat protein
MKHFLRSSVRFIVIGAAMSAAALTSQAELTVGDLAPKLQVGKWVQGEPVSDFDSNHVFIVEFWATWCGPCRVSIPHLNQLAETFKEKGMIVIGQDVWDGDDGVASFVKQMGDKMTYRVALDDKSSDHDGFMAAHWWKRGVEHHGIPTAFIITKERRIAWIGHPMDLNEALLIEVLSDHYDLVKAAADHNKELREEQRFQELNDKLRAALNQEKWDAASAALDEKARLVPEERRKDYGLGTRLKILLGQKKYDEAYRLAESFSDSHPEDYYQHNDFAWTILTQKGVEQRNLSLARKLAERASKASGGTDASILDTLARAQFMTGKTNEAVATEQQAANLAQAGEKTELEKTLTSYRQGKLPEVK